MRLALVFLFMLSLLMACKPIKKVACERDSMKIKSLNKLSRYIERKALGVYDFRYDKVILPIGYDTITWTNDFGNSWKGKDVDSIYIKYLMYGKMLDSLLLFEMTDAVKYEEIVRYYGEPSSYSTKRDGIVTDLNYQFNTPFNKNCAEQKIGFISYSGCSLLSFKIDDDGKLYEVNKMMFSP